MRSPFSFATGPLPPVVACTSSDGKAWRALPTQMNARTPADEQVPSWVADAALRQSHTASKDSKCAFNLLPERVRALRRPYKCLSRLHQLCLLCELCRLVHAHYCKEGPRLDGFLAVEQHFHLPVRRS